MEEAYSKYTGKCNLAWIEGNPGIKVILSSLVQFGLLNVFFTSSL